MLHNAAIQRRAWNLSPASVGVSWLPLYHDLGVISCLLQPVFVGFHTVLMSPADFVQRPLRWLQAISRYRGTFAGGPNFAFDLCVRGTTPAQRAQLDLRSWETAFNGAEPIRPESLDRFADAFASAGFRRSALYPCYGLAEANFVSGMKPGAGSDRRTLRQGGPRARGGRSGDAGRRGRDQDARARELRRDRAGADARDRRSGVGQGLSAWARGRGLALGRERRARVLGAARGTRGHLRRDARASATRASCGRGIWGSSRTGTSI